MKIDQWIYALVDYGRQKRFFHDEDSVFMINRILEVLQLESIDYSEKYGGNDGGHDLQTILKAILDWAGEQGVMEENTATHRDLLDAKLMGILLPKPSEVIKTFEDNYRQSPVKATEAYYRMSIDGNYIRKDRTDHNLHWTTATDYGEMEITINLSKPEKDPKTIAMEKSHPTTGYPKCLLCRENEGYAGRINHPARQNLRLIPVALGQEPWYFQYSPYLYYNEHSIIFSGEHRPMMITKATFRRMLEFVDRFPHYFAGSNADLPIVGGSILSHDHYQGGRHVFPMEKSPSTRSFVNLEHPNVKASWIHWPLSVIRLQGDSREALINCAWEIHKTWRDYDDDEREILSKTGSTPHNTVTPIARMREGMYELDVVLRNNRTSEKYPEGVFHPHREIHGVKKENIGLIEVMGLAILPPRLKGEMELIVRLFEGEDLSMEETDEIEKHQEMIKELKKELEELLKEEYIDGSFLLRTVKNAVGRRFIKGLQHAGVFKETPEGRDGFLRFMTLMGWKERDQQ